MTMVRVPLCLAAAVTLASVLVSGCGDEPTTPPPVSLSLDDLLPSKSAAKERAAEPTTDHALVAAAIERTQHTVVYDPAYVQLDYPGGDVPAGTGVCTDVLVRAYRTLGIDLQKLVHEDMAAAFGEYPNNWGLTKPDANIDHRRVPNLQKFFTRHGETRPKTTDAADYQPGDVVTWNVGRNRKHVDHIGVVSNVLNAEQTRYQIVHNIGAGPVLADVLFDWTITGHYRYLPTPQT